MQFTLPVTVFTILSSLALATPVPEPASNAVNMMAATQQWTVQNFTRTCNAADTSCKYTYGVNPKDTAASQCSYTVNAAKQASRTSYNGIKCGAFTVSSNWSGQFGAGSGFQTLSVVRNRQIIYPAYTDKQLVNGKTVTPDQSYTPQNLP